MNDLELCVGAKVFSNAVMKRTENGTAITLARQHFQIILAAAGYYLPPDSPVGLDPVAVKWSWPMSDRIDFYRSQKRI